MGRIACGLAILMLATLAAAQAAKRYPRMAPGAHYRMDRNVEIALARTAAPAAISGQATILVLGPGGYETAVAGSDGFVCLVERSWISALDFSEVWNPKIHGPDCLNPPAVRSILPIYKMKTKLVLAAVPERQVAAALKAAFAKRELPPLRPGAMGFMMSKSAYLTDSGAHNLSHLMVFTNQRDGHSWGADVPNSPVDAAFFWFPEDPTNPLARGLPVIRVFIVAVANWSDGTPVVASH